MRPRTNSIGTLAVVVVVLIIGVFRESSVSTTYAFPITPSTQHRVSHRERVPVLKGYSRSSPRTSKNTERSKRQERVGHLVRTEISNILHGGVIKGQDAEYLDAELRQRISVVSADISPDLRQARISVSVRAPPRNDQAEYNPAVDKRRAYAWLVRNTKPIRHTLAQRMSHMKSCPNLSFVQVDVAAAVDVMYLIDKVSQGYKRDKVDLFNGENVPTGVMDGIDFDEEFDEEDWDEDDEDFL
jgi:ribosome-binding factor A